MTLEDEIALVEGVLRYGVERGPLRGPEPRLVVTWVGKGGGIGRLEVSPAGAWWRAVVQVCLDRDGLAIPPPPPRETGFRVSPGVPETIPRGG